MTTGLISNGAAALSEQTPAHCPYNGPASKEGRRSGRPYISVVEVEHVHQVADRRGIDGNIGVGAGERVRQVVAAAVG